MADFLQTTVSGRMWKAVISQFSNFAESVLRNTLSNLVEEGPGLATWDMLVNSCSAKIHAGHALDRRKTSYFSKIGNSLYMHSLFVVTGRR